MCLQVESLDTRLRPTSDPQALKEKGALGLGPMYMRSISADQCNSTIAPSHSVRVLTHVNVPAVPLVGHPSWTASSNDYTFIQLVLALPLPLHLLVI